MGVGIGTRYRYRYGEIDRPDTTSFFPWCVPGTVLYKRINREKWDY